MKQNRQYALSQEDEQKDKQVRQQKDGKSKRLKIDR